MTNDQAPMTKLVLGIRFPANSGLGFHLPLIRRPQFGKFAAPLINDGQTD
jgi:hypothetical protein